MDYSNLKQTEKGISRCFWSDYMQTLPKTLWKEIKSIYYPKEVTLETKCVMAEILFELEQKYEYSERTRYKADHFRRIRNMLYDDIGVNEPRNSKVVSQNRVSHS